MSTHAPADSAPAVFPFRRISPWIAALNLLAVGESFRLRTPLKFFVRALSQPRLTHIWLARIVQPDVAALWVAHPRLATKLQRPYVSCSWSRLQSFAALMGHYDSLVRVLSPNARSEVYEEGLTLVRVATPTTGRRIEVRLTYRDQFEKEGEMTLLLHDLATGLTLAGLTFCVAYNAGKRVIIIGGLQASPDPRVRDLIHDVAKECHGLRPKALALWCLQELASCWQVRQIEAVGDEQHIYRHSHKRREFAASYDEFWAESDGRRLSAGSWELPLQLRTRTREELKPNRRKAHERRYAMLCALRPELLAAIRSFAPDGLKRGFVPSDAVEVTLPGREPAAGAVPANSVALQTA